MRVPVLVTMVLATSCECALFTERPPRVLDGSLRCYQCSSYDKEDAESRFVCNVSNWKSVSVPQKWAMIMQCPRRKSAFCRLVLEPESGRTVRGCAGPDYADGRPAHVGCFDTDTSRACLCDTNMCNLARHSGRAPAPLFIVVSAIPVLCTGNTWALGSFTL